jgi:hypothetical protein
MNYATSRYSTGDFDEAEHVLSNNDKKKMLFCWKGLDDGKEFVDRVVHPFNNYSNQFNRDTTYLKTSPTNKHGAP